MLYPLCVIMLINDGWYLVFYICKYIQFGLITTFHIIGINRIFRLSSAAVALSRRPTTAAAGLWCSGLWRAAECRSRWIYAASIQSRSSPLLMRVLSGCGGTAGHGGRMLHVHKLWRLRAPVLHLDSGIRRSSRWTSSGHRSPWQSWMILQWYGCRWFCQMIRWRVNPL